VEPAGNRGGGGPSLLDVIILSSLGRGVAEAAVLVAVRQVVDLARRGPAVD
jgi:L-cystine uptake protein TcyP (sodium:dicarboxylate symporter family)